MRRVACAVASISAETMVLKGKPGPSYDAKPSPRPPGPAKRSITCICLLLMLVTASVSLLLTENVTVDVVEPAVRSRMMAGIRGKDTRPEMIVRRWLHRAGFRYRLHVRDLPGSPDLVLPRWRVCIFVQGCFWHRHVGCRYTTTPATRAEFWAEKFAQNVARDQRNRQQLLESGWRVFELWECGLRGRAPDLDWLCNAIRDPAFGSCSWPEPKGAG